MKAARDDSRSILLQDSQTREQRSRKAAAPGAAQDDGVTRFQLSPTARAGAKAAPKVPKAKVPNKAIRSP